MRHRHQAVRRPGAEAARARRTRRRRTSCCRTTTCSSSTPRRDMCEFTAGRRRGRRLRAVSRRAPEDRAHPRRAWRRSSRACSTTEVLERPAVRVRGRPPREVQARAGRARGGDPRRRRRPRTPTTCGDDLRAPAARGRGRFRLHACSSAPTRSGCRWTAPPCAGRRREPAGPRRDADPAAQDVEARGQGAVRREPGLQPLARAGRARAGRAASPTRARSSTRRRPTLRRDANGVPLASRAEPRPPSRSTPTGATPAIVRAAIHPAIGVARVGNSEERVLPRARGRPPAARSRPASTRTPPAR